MRRKPVDILRPDVAASLQDWHRALVSRRAFLLGLAGGSLATLFGISAAARDSADIDESHAWQVIDMVQQHLFPSEPDSPGAKQINALAYLRFVVRDPKVEAEEREFIVKGAGWLEGMAQEMTQRTFTELGESQREQVLRRIAASQAGENWLSTLILYLMEALLTDPAYGGNPGGIGWRWLQHVPGYPRPPTDKTYPELLG
jgi:gluconate 2-dehydrogenase gamma chain